MHILLVTEVADVDEVVVAVVAVDDVEVDA